MTVVLTLTTSDVNNLKNGGVIPIALYAELNSTKTAYNVIATRVTSDITSENIGTVDA